MTRMSTVEEYRLGRDFPYLVIPCTNPTIGIPAYSVECALSFASHIDRHVDVAEDYLHIPITVDMRMRFRLPDPVTPPETLDGWHPFIQASHEYFLRKRATKEWRVETRHERGRTAFFVARPTFMPWGRNRLNSAA